MATNNFIVTSLPDYVQENRDLLIKRIALGAATVARMTKQTGIKQDAYLNYLDITPVLQDGKGCGFTPQGDVELSDRVIKTAMLKVNLEVCPEKLRGKYAEYLLRTAAGEHDLPFEAEIVDGIVEWIQNAIEKAVWQGDTASSDANLKHFDGLLKIADNAEGVIKVDTNGLATATAAIKAVYMAIPEEVLNRGDVSIHVAPATFRKYVAELVDANLYHYPGPQEANPGEIVMPGSDVKVVRTAGLAGTDKILAAWDRNLYYGTDLEGDAEDIDITWSDREETYAVKARWNSGTQIAFPDQVVLAYAGAGE